MATCWSSKHEGLQEVHGVTLRSDFGEEIMEEKNTGTAFDHCLPKTTSWLCIFFFST